jgi:hypothetical protein
LHSRTRGDFFVRQTEENHQRLLRLLRLNESGQILDEEFQQQVKLAKSYLIRYKIKYNLPINDPRFQELTLSEALNDDLIDAAVDYVEKFESKDPETNEFAKQHALNPKKASEDERKKDAEMLLKFALS